MRCSGFSRESAMWGKEDERSHLLDTFSINVRSNHSFERNFQSKVLRMGMNMRRRTFLLDQSPDWKEVSDCALSRWLSPWKRCWWPWLCWLWWLFLSCWSPEKDADDHVCDDCDDFFILLIPWKRCWWPWLCWLWWLFYLADPLKKMLMTMFMMTMTLVTTNCDSEAY